MNRVLSLTALAALGLTPALAAPTQPAFSAAPAVLQAPLTQARLATPVTRRFTINAGGGYVGGFVFNAGIAANNLVDFGRSSLGARFGVEALGPAGVSLGADLLFIAPLEVVTLYAGPGIGYSLNSGGVFGNVVAGASVPIDASLGVYGEGLYRFYFSGGGTLGVRAGLNYSF